MGTCGEARNREEKSQGYKIPFNSISHLSKVLGTQESFTMWTVRDIEIQFAAAAKNEYEITIWGSIYFKNGICIHFFLSCPISPATLGLNRSQHMDTFGHCKHLSSHMFSKLVYICLFFARYTNTTITSGFTYQEFYCIKCHLRLVVHFKFITNSNPEVLKNLNKAPCFWIHFFKKWVSFN